MDGFGWMIHRMRYTELEGKTWVVIEISSILVPRRRALNRRPTIFLILSFVHMRYSFIAISFFLVRLILVLVLPNDQTIKLSNLYWNFLLVCTLVFSTTRLDHLTLYVINLNRYNYAKRTHTYIRCQVRMYLPEFMRFLFLDPFSFFPGLYAGLYSHSGKLFPQKLQEEAMRPTNRS